MTLDLTSLIKNKVLFLNAEKKILKKAVHFYKFGFSPKNLSSAQIAAVSVILQRAIDLDDAHKKLTNFLDNQLKKLKKKAEKYEKKESWLKEPAISNEKDSLGDTLKHWVQEKKYIPDNLKNSDLDNITILRIFWNCVSGQFSFHKTFDKGMSLQED